MPQCRCWQRREHATLHANVSKGGSLHKGLACAAGPVEEEGAPAGVLDRLSDGFKRTPLVVVQAWHVALHRRLQRCSIVRSLVAQKAIAVAVDRGHEVALRRRELDMLQGHTAAIEADAEVAECQIERVLLRRALHAEALSQLVSAILRKL